MSGRLVWLVLALALAVAGCGGSKSGSKTETVQLGAQSGSGESGTAVLTEEGKSTRVVIDLSNGTTEPQPAHIHSGSCAKLDPTPKYALQNVVDGKSTSMVNEPLDDLKSEAYAINVHKSAAQIKTYVSCGDIGGKGGSSGGGQPGY
jgi:hypothetical protein